MCFSRSGASCKGTSENVVCVYLVVHSAPGQPLDEERTYLCKACFSACIHRTNEGEVWSEEVTPKFLEGITPLAGRTLNECIKALEKLPKKKPAETEGDSKEGAAWDKYVIKE